MLDRDIIDKIIKEIQNKQSISYQFQKKFLSDSSNNPGDMNIKIDNLPEKVYDLIKSFNFEEEILKNIKYAPQEKISFELAKHQIDSGELNTAKETLLSITQKYNSDWRIVYRSFCLLSLIFKNQNNHPEYTRYRNLCLTSNPGYPLSILDSQL